GRAGLCALPHRRGSAARVASLARRPSTPRSPRTPPQGSAPLTPGSTSVFGHLTQFRSRLRTHGLLGRTIVEEPPLRSELFSADQMERYGRTLAGVHRVTSHQSRDALLP